jgi:hypothetical protein
MTTKQWCHECFDYLMEEEKDEFGHKLSALRILVHVLDKNISERRAVQAQQAQKGEETLA